MLNKKFIYFILLSVTLRIFSPNAVLAYIFLSVYALGGLKNNIHALLLSWFFTMINPDLVVDPSEGGVGKYLVIIFVAASAIFRSFSISNGLKIYYINYVTLLLGIFFVGHSMVVSPYPDVSILKAVSWALVITSAFSSWINIDGVEVEALKNEIYFFMALMSFSSVPLYFVGSGYIVNGSGFQGVLNHPQVFGPVMAIVCTISLGRAFRQIGNFYFNIFVALVAVVFIFASEARTAGVSLVLAFVCASFFHMVAKRVGLFQILPGILDARFIYLVFFVVVLFVVGGSVFSDKLYQYVSKRGDGGSLVDAYDGSRGALIDRMMINIKKNPISGIGFGIASNPDGMMVDRDPMFNIPLGATIEKGVLPIAVVEEVGIVGALFSFFWIFVVWRCGISGDFVGSIILWLVIFMNFGESTFFSPGGTGLINLVLLGWAFSRRVNL